VEGTMIGIYMKKRNRDIFVDTIAHFAIANAEDVDHKRAKKFLQELAGEQSITLVTNFIIAETYTLMLRKIGRTKAINYIDALRNTSEVIRVSEYDEKRAWKIILQYQDKDFSYVDATSFAVMQRLGIKEAFAFDEHFAQYGLIKLP
jgi:predicted nucleic acid-binding protein